MISMGSVVIGAKLHVEQVRVGRRTVDGVQLARSFRVGDGRSGAFAAGNRADLPVEIGFDVERRLAATLE